MKTFIFQTFTTLLLTTSLCIAQTKKEYYNANEGWNSSPKQEVQAKKYPVQKRAIGPFDRIAIEGNFQVYLYAGKEDSISVEAPAQIHKLIITKVENGKLTVKMKPHTWFSKNFKDWNRQPKKIIRIPVDRIDAISFSGSGHIKTENLYLDSPALEIHSSGSGKITAQVNSQRLELKKTGSGSILLSGKTNRLQAKISGSGAIKLKELKAQFSTVKLSGSGSIHLDSQQLLNAEISGSGRVLYKNYTNLKIDSQVSGSGRLRSY